MRMWKTGKTPPIAGVPVLLRFTDGTMAVGVRDRNFDHEDPKQHMYNIVQGVFGGMLVSHWEELPDQPGTDNVCYGDPEADFGDIDVDRLIEETLRL